jgi:hypothetical protein
VGYSGKIALDVSDITRSDLVRSEPFQAWLAEYDVPYSPAMCGMPVGTVVEGKDIARQMFVDFQVFTPEAVSQVSISFE